MYHVSKNKVFRHDLISTYKTLNYKLYTIDNFFNLNYRSVLLSDE